MFHRVATVMDVASAACHIRRALSPKGSVPSLHTLDGPVVVNMKNWERSTVSCSKSITERTVDPCNETWIVAGER